MKCLLSLMLSLALMLALATPAFAASGTITAQQAADALHEMGLFNGTGTDANGRPVYDLDRAPTRHEAITMLVRLLGKTYEAESGTWPMPFTDVADWAKPYVGYAYANGLAGGTSATAFSGNQTVTAAQYLTFVLRALGYESGTDFQWDRAWELSDRIGLTNGQYHTGTVNFTRGDVAIISYNALNCAPKENSPNGQPSPSVPGNSLAPAINKAPNEIKLKILENMVYSADHTLKGSEYLGAAMTEDESAIVQILHANQAQIEMKAATSYMDIVINLCGNFEDTQFVKAYFTEYRNLLSILPTDTVVDADTAIKYLASLLVLAEPLSKEGQGLPSWEAAIQQIDSW